MIDKDYMNSRQEHFRDFDIPVEFNEEDDDGWIWEADEALAYYQIMKTAEKYCHEFFNMLCARDGIRERQPLPLVYRTEAEAMVESMDVFDNEFGSWHPGTMQKGEWGNVAINITIPVGMDKNLEEYIVELPPMIKMNMRHELIHYYLYLREFPNRDNDGLFWAYCYIYDAGAYDPMSEDDIEKYDRFVGICERDGQHAALCDLQTLAEAIMLDDDDSMSEWNMMIRWRNYAAEQTTQ